MLFYCRLLGPMTLKLSGNVYYFRGQKHFVELDPAICQWKELMVMKLPYVPLPSAILCNPWKAHSKALGSA